MKNKTLLAGLLLSTSSLFACGAEEPPAASLEGGWIFADDARNIGAGLTVSGNEYVSSVIRLTSGTSADVQSESGAFVVEGDEIVTTPTEDTCSGSAKPGRFPFALEGDVLTLASPEGVVSYRRCPAAAPGTSRSVSVASPPTGRSRPGR